MKTFLFILGLSLVPTNAFANKIQFRGVAYSSEKKIETAYTEEHTRQFQEGKLLNSITIYKDTEGKVIAKLECNYEGNLTLPDFTFEDFRTGYYEKVSLKKNKVTVEHKDSKDSKLVTKKLKYNDQLAASQGLNELIRTNLAKLSKGNTVVASLLLPSRFQDVDMRLKAKSLKEKKLQVNIEINNFFLRLFAPRLEIVYAKEDGKLLSYFGQSNILTKNGDKQKVFIEYDYNPQLAKNDNP